MTKKLQNMSKYPKCKISRKAKKNGSIFSIICIARRALHKHGLNAEAEEMATKVGFATSYAEALHIIGKYVDLR